jgi:hypothetical protein
MAATIEMLKKKIAHLQEELAEVSAALDELASSPPPASPATPPGTVSAAGRPDPLAGVRFSDPKALLPLLDKAFAEMGIDVTQPAPTPEEVQQLMLREGVRPEDNILSRAIIEAREE